MIALTKPLAQDFVRGRRRFELSFDGSEQNRWSPGNSRPRAPDCVVVFGTHGV
jgi:hypothetical protein